MLVDLLSWRSIKIRIFTLNICCNDVLWYCNVQRKVWLCKVIILVIPLHLLFNLFDQTIYLEGSVSYILQKNKGEILGLKWKPMFALSLPLPSQKYIKLGNYNMVTNMLLIWIQPDWQSRNVIFVEKFSIVIYEVILSDYLDHT